MRAKKKDMYKSCCYCAKLPEPHFIYWSLKNKFCKLVAHKIFNFFRGDKCWGTNCKIPCFKKNGIVDKESLMVYKKHNEVLENFYDKNMFYYLATTKIENPMTRVFAYITIHLIEHIFRKPGHDTSEKKYRIKIYQRLRLNLSLLLMSRDIYLSFDYTKIIVEAAYNLSFDVRLIKNIPYYPAPYLYKHYVPIIRKYYLKKEDIYMLNWFTNFYKSNQVSI